MATRAISFHTLVCDGCATTFGMDEYYSSIIEARAVAHNKGWRFPAKVGKTTTSSSVSDVCPTCVPGWIPQPAPNPWKNRPTKKAPNAS